MQMVLELEASGYPSGESFSPQHWHTAVFAGRKYEVVDSKTNETKTYALLQSIGQLEEELKTQETLLRTANPDNWYDRNSIRNTISKVTGRLDSRRALIYRFILHKHYELKFSGIADDVFSRIRQRVDGMVGQLLPDAVKRFTSIYDNLQSENPEDWSNAVHSCRRILQDLADAVFPPTDEERTVVIGGKERKIKLGQENYINRIMAFVEDRSDSERFKDLVGSHLNFLGERLDSIFKASQKGSHTTIIRKEEADRYVLYTYMVIGDILSLPFLRDVSLINTRGCQSGIPSILCPQCVPRNIVLGIKYLSIESPLGVHHH